MKSLEEKTINRRLKNLNINMYVLGKDKKMKKSFIKKVAALTTAVVCTAAFTACGGTANDSSKVSSTSSASAVSTSSEASATSSSSTSKSTSTEISTSETSKDNTAGLSEDFANLKGKKIDVLLKSYTHMFWVEAANEAKELGEKYGAEVEILAPTTSNSNEEQIQLIEQSLVSPPDLYIIVPADSAGIESAIEEINDAGVPIVNVNTKIESESATYDSYVSCNQYDLGYTTVSTAIEKIGDEGNAVIIFGKPGAQTYVDRGKGAEDAFAEHEGWNVLDNQVANGDRNEAMTVMQTLLTKYKDIDLVYAEDGEMALGAAEAIKQAGRQDDIKIVCENSNKEICESITDGLIYFTYDDAAWAQTYLGFQVADAIFGGKDVDDIYYSEIYLVDESNVAEYSQRYAE